MSDEERVFPHRIDQTQRTLPKRAKISLGRLDLYRLLEVPEGVDIAALQVTQDPLTLQVIVTGDRLPVRPLAWGEESRMIDFAQIIQFEDKELPQASRLVWLDDSGYPI